MKIGNHLTTYVCGPGAMEQWKGETGDVVIVSNIIDELFPEKVEKIERTMHIIVNDGESAKSMESYNDLCTKLMELGMGRDNTLWYLGGGTIGDLTGFVASTFKRGVGFSAIPTTFLSQIDSAIGGKNGINISSTKNMVGTFRNPDIILSDTEFIQGNASIIMDGLPEAIKHGFALNNNIIEFLEQTEPEKIISGEKLPEFIMMNAMAKGEICNMDPEERGETRFLLNFGHTVGHGIEAATHNAISHGTAVLMGMRMEMLVASEIEGPIAGDPLAKLDHIVEKYNLKIPKLKQNILEDAWTYMARDKKILRGEIHIPVIERSGNIRIRKIELDTLKPIYWKVLGTLSS